jgi:DNA replication and repair protein RecF
MAGPIVPEPTADLYRRGLEMADTPASALSIARLTLTQFRCYAQADLTLDTRPVVLTGPNGAGKTAILEAVSLFAPGRGLRGAKIVDLKRKSVSGEAGHQDWAVAASLRSDVAGDAETKLGTGTNGAERRIARINGASAKSAADFGAFLRVAWLTPAMDRLFIEGAGGRRKFFDRLVLGLFPSHASHAVQYERAMQERTRLLKSGGGDPSWLTALEARMAEHGLALSHARASYADKLSEVISAAPENAFPKAHLTLDGLLEPRVLRENEAELQAKFAGQLEGGRGRDAAAGRALIGPHRTDLGVVHAPKNCPARDCSTGEQKALLIGIVLAGARAAMDADNAPPPVLLLDEIAAHLDDIRRAVLFDQICDMGAQAFMTGTDATLFTALEDRAQYFHVANAALNPSAPPPMHT